MRGKLIVFDGGDGAGKETQTKLLVAALVAMGYTTHTVSFPRYEAGFFGRELRKMLDGKYGDFGKVDPYIASLWYAMDRWAAKSEIEAYLERGAFVVLDRYKSANEIHQGGKIADRAVREKFLFWLDELEFGELAIPRPDISIYLDVPPVVSAQLMSQKTRDIVEDCPSYLENSHESAQWLVARYPEQWIHIQCCRKEGTLRTREDIHEEVVAQLKARSIL